MNKNYTLKELADIGSKAACLDTAGAVKLHQNCREAFTKAVLDAIGYEFPKDEELEAFDRWLEKSNLGYQDTFFEIWKAGREELRRAQLLDKQPAEPAWIPWEGGKCPLEDGVIWEAKLRSGTHVKAKGLACRWDHNGRAGDIVAYRVLEG